MTPKTNSTRMKNPPPSNPITDPAMRKVKARPFIKWAGGKSQLLPAMLPHVPSPETIGRYFEPFMGGAALFFAVQHPQSFLSDRNPDLVELYQVVQQHVDELILALKIHRNEREYFYEVRALNPKELSPVQRAARLIYLNKTCYNGLYRVNSKGQFNVPFGRYKNPTICDEVGLHAASLALQSAEIKQNNFESILKQARPNDFIYFDPPYQPLNKTSSFTSYTSDKFGEAEQKRLAEVFTELAEHGCYVMLSNSDAQLIRKLYRDFTIYEIQAGRAINSKAAGRGKITELLIVNVPNTKK
jgi:DNA adenine methylase